jgi:hypothetical protein
MMNGYMDAVNTGMHHIFAHAVKRIICELLFFCQIRLAGMLMFAFTGAAISLPGVCSAGTLKRIFFCMKLCYRISFR